MKYLFIFWIILFVNIVKAQTQTPFEQIIGAENNFEKACLDSGIRKGFLANLDSTAIIFTNKGIENAREFWKSLPESPAIYSWAPSFAEVSLSGDWGYTTGAVEYRDSSMKDEPSAYNQYTTIWQKNNDGTWKYLVDIGNTHGPITIDRTAKEIAVKKVASKNIDGDFILNLEKSYYSQFKTNAVAAIKKNYGKNFLLNFAGHAVITNIDTAITLFKPVAQTLIFYPIDVRVSPKGDMAVVSGNLIRNNKKNYYIRIWRHEVTGWKIALEVARI